MLDRDLIVMRAHVLQVNTAQLSALSGIPSNKLSLFLGGTRGLQNHEITRLRAAIDDIEALVRMASPFPLSFRDVGRIKDLIARMKAGEFGSREKVAPEAQ
jgi:hypothetical protein